MAVLGRAALAKPRIDLLGRYRANWGSANNTVHADVRYDAFQGCSATIVPAGEIVRKPQ